MTTITICTPWHNEPDLLADYAAAIAASSADAVIVVDNGSDPRLTPHGDLQIVRNAENRGFTRACNQGLDAATTDAVLWLNSDVKLSGVPHDWLAPIRSQLRPGLLVGAELRTDAHGDVDDRPHAYLDGWCLAGMTADLRSLGGFDESYEEPAYYCENDLCLRARRAGMRLVRVPTGLVHLENRTVRALHDKAFVWEVTQRNRERFAQLERRDFNLALSA